MFEETIEVTCPKCGNKSQENVGRLNSDGYTCHKCGATGDSSELVRADKERFADLKGQLAKLKKRLGF